MKRVWVIIKLPTIHYYERVMNTCIPIDEGVRILINKNTTHTWHLVHVAFKSITNACTIPIDESVYDDTTFACSRMKATRRGSCSLGESTWDKDFVSE